MDNVMVDLETMGTDPDAAVIAIGAVFFDLDKGELGDEFYNIVTLDSNHRTNRNVSAETLKWWMKQSEEARAIFNSQLAIPLALALANFGAYLAKFEDTAKKAGNVKLWGNGSDFDNVILTSCYATCNMALPWKYFNNRCYRTMKSLSSVAMNRVGTHHNALDDAKSQAEHLLRIFKDLM